WFSTQIAPFVAARPIGPPAVGMNAMTPAGRGAAIAVAAGVAPADDGAREARALGAGGEPGAEGVAPPHADTSSASAATLVRRRGRAIRARPRSPRGSCTASTCSPMRSARDISLAPFWFTIDARSASLISTLGSAERVAHRLPDCIAGHGRRADGTCGEIDLVAAHVGD